MSFKREKFGAQRHPLPSEIESWDFAQLFFNSFEIDLGAVASTFFLTLNKDYTA